MIKWMISGLSFLLNLVEYASQTNKKLFNDVELFLGVGFGFQGPGLLPLLLPVQFLVTLFPTHPRDVFPEKQVKLRLTTTSRAKQAQVELVLIN